MEFKVPKTKNMKTLYNLIEKFYKDKFMSFVEEMDQRVFHFYTENDVYAIVFMVEENKFDIFKGEEGLFTLHFLLSADDRNIRTYGLHSITIEPKDNDELINGSEYFKEKFPHYTYDDLPVVYSSNKPGQKPISLEEDEVLFAIDALRRLFIIKNEYDKKRLEKPKFESNDAVCIFEFTGKKFKATYALLEDYEFLPEIDVNRFDNIPLGIDYRELEIKPGTLYIGQIYGFNTYESYASLAPFEVDLTPIMLYSINEEGDIVNYMYSSPKEDSDIILSAMISKYINEHGIYDTIVTDNYLLHLFLKRIDIDGVDIKFEPSNDIISFVTKYMIKTSKYSKDAEEFVNIINETKEDIKDIFLTNIYNLDEVAENLFNEEIIEESEEDEEFFSDDEDENYYVS